MRHKLSVILLLVAPVTGCSYRYDIIAAERSGKIVFLPAKEAGTGCLSDFSVVDESNRVVWAISSGKYLPPPCRNKFPITYGVTPAGLTQKVKPMSLQEGAVYQIEGWDGDSYSGAFSFSRGIVVKNIERAP